VTQTQYQVVAPIAYATTDTATGPTKLAYYRGSLLPEGTKPTQIEHLLSVQAIAPVQVGAPEPVVTGEEAGDGPVVPPAGDGDNGESPVSAGNGQPDGEGNALPLADNPDADAEQKWADAVGKAEALTASGSKPDGRSNPLVIAAYLVGKGYDRAAVEKAEKKDLLDLVGSVNQ
jgi:hypothetical protein